MAANARCVPFSLIYEMVARKRGFMKSALAGILSLLRREAGYSQRQAAIDLGVSQALLSHYENGAREPKLEFIVKACDYYNVSADYLLGRNDERGGESARLAKTVNDIVHSLEDLKLAETDLIIRLKQSVNTGR